MRRTRIEKPRRAARPRRRTDDSLPLSALLDPRDPDILRAKRLQRAQRDGGYARP
ncbi:hypothetical protein ACFS5L_01355 [Streptomyces phyllanthi]|uniref:hypothetical protein n=1 Tax=Streptomyces phyllanthi TaxID=1803180 RepID=UPI00188372E6|nr:hypothetical protein [Streptomyces phyllanthi]